jgi:hypothetical protein
MPFAAIIFFKTVSLVSTKLLYMKILKTLSLLLLVFFCLSFTPLHHGWADYDQENPIEFTGTIRELAYENPHALIKINQDEKIWTVYLAPISRMQARGVTEEMVKKGAVIKVLGYPHKKIKDEMRAERIFVNDQKYELR